MRLSSAILPAFTILSFGSSLALAASKNYPTKATNDGSPAVDARQIGNYAVDRKWHEKRHDTPNIKPNRVERANNPSYQSEGTLTSTSSNESENEKVIKEEEGQTHDEPSSSLTPSDLHYARHTNVDGAKLDVYTISLTRDTTRLAARSAVAALGARDILPRQYRNADYSTSAPPADDDQSSAPASNDAAAPPAKNKAANSPSSTTRREETDDKGGLNGRSEIGEVTSSAKRRLTNPWF